MMALWQGTWGTIDWAVAILIFLGILAIGWIVVKNLGLPIPLWVWQMIGVVILIGFAIIAIKFLASM